MKLKHKILFLTMAFALLLASCDDGYGPRKESTPVFESVSISPTTFNFGDSILLTARITDPATTLTALAYEVVSGNRVITSDEIPIGGDSYDVSLAIFVPLLNNQADNAEIAVNLVASNILEGTASYQVTGLIGNRPVYSQLYLVIGNGNIAILQPQPEDNNKFQANSLTFDTSFQYRIAEKLNADNTIDYSGDVYGNVDGRIGMINETGEPAFVYTPLADYTDGFTFDQYDFSVTTTGSDLGADDLALSIFTDQEINGETFYVLQRELQNGNSYTAVGELADVQNIFNVDFFERTATNRVTFLGKTGDYTIYYNPVRKNTIVGIENPSYPDYLLACGLGLGYPTNITSEQIASVYPDKGRTHTEWSFGNVMNYVLLRQIDDGVYQGTFYTPADHDHSANFKLYENTSWGNEKQAGSLTFTGENIISGSDNWDIPNGDDDPVIESANYRFTVNLNNNTVYIEKITI